MQLNKRLEKLEKQLTTSTMIPVVFIEPYAAEVTDGVGCLVVRSKEELNQYAERINDSTVIFSEDILQEYA